MVIEKPRAMNIAYIPSLKQGFVDLTPEQEVEFTKQASDLHFIICVLSMWDRKRDRMLQWMSVVMVSGINKSTL